MPGIFVLKNKTNLDRRYTWCYADKFKMNSTIEAAKYYRADSAEYKQLFSGRYPGNLQNFLGSLV